MGSRIRGIRGSARLSRGDDAGRILSYSFFDTQGGFKYSKIELCTQSFYPNVYFYLFKSLFMIFMQNNLPCFLGGR